MIVYRKLGDGRCDLDCDMIECTFDNGDCLQLCFAPELGNCTYDKFTNDECDEGCDTKYCMEYQYGSDFSTPDWSGCPKYEGDKSQCQGTSNNSNL